MTPTTLELIDTAALLTELFGRFENAVFVGQKPYTDTSMTSKACMWRYKGDPFLCLGLASTLENILNEDIALHTDMTDPSNI